MSVLKTENSFRWGRENEGVRFVVAQGGFTGGIGTLSQRIVLERLRLESGLHFSFGA